MTVSAKVAAPLIEAELDGWDWNAYDPGDNPVRTYPEVIVAGGHVWMGPQMEPVSLSPEEARQVSETLARAADEAEKEGER